ncbi:hypothetical protein HGRIS_014939 [Hohenbuehelia grisea]|uniref:F-box domain-containing protein n=1 Tax=Hohenbuehelia grisea TaxID=104357 RepID=A0ABR3J5P8_9AGAR
MSTLGDLAKLPAEIVCMIFNEIGDVEDAICLALTNHTLLGFGVERVNHLANVLNTPHSWRGDRIVLLGDWNEDDDAPKGLITEEDLKFFEERGIGWSSVTSEEGYTVTDTSPPSLQKYLPGHGPFPDFFTLERVSTLDFVSYLNIISAEQFYPEQPVLLNLSKRLYVVGESFEKSTHPRGFGLGNAIQTRICWSTVYPESSDPPICRGVWAGDRFALEDQAYVDRLVSEGEEWTDVTEEIAKELVKHWEEFQASE